MNKNRIRTILVDDEPRGLNTLKKLLQEYCPDISIVAECMDAQSARTQIETLKPQLIFLDISMPGKSGIDLLNDFDDIPFEIIFVTAHDQYMLQAFRFSAVDYLLKPVDEDILVNAVERATKRIASRIVHPAISTLMHNISQSGQPENMRLCITSQKGFVVVNIRDILYCAAEGSYTNVYFADRPFICVSKHLSKYEQLLGDAGFVRIHKSFLVNIIHVKEYYSGDGGTVVLSNDVELAVSRRQRENFIARIKDRYRY